MAVGIKEIAEECGVSVHTVSDILNRKRDRGYSAATRQRIIEASERLNYSPNRAAQAMRSRKTREVGFAARNFSSEGHLENYGVYPFLVGMSHVLTASDYRVSLVGLEELEFSDSSELPEVLKERSFDGLVINYGLSPQAASLVPQSDVPIVWWDSGMKELNGCLYRNEREVAAQITRHLIGLGHRHISFMAGGQSWKHYLAGRPAHFALIERYEGYRDEMAAHGLADEVIAGYDLDGICAQIQKFHTTAIITRGASEIALWMQVANQLGLKIPDDLSVATCDREARIPFSGLKPGGLPYDRYETGRMAARMLLYMMNAPGEPAITEVPLGEFDPGNTVAPCRVGGY